MSRAIWYYGVDKGHAFATFSHHVWWNVLIMTFLWAKNFDPQYCRHGCEDLVKQFV